MTTGMTDRLGRIRVVSATTEIVAHELAHPMVLSSGTITALPEAIVRVRVSDGQHEADGVGAVNLSDVWAWPGPEPSSTAKQQAMSRYCERLTDSATERTGDPAHPLELGMRLHESVVTDTEGSLPVLARAVCSAALDAGIHDGAGRLVGRSAFSFYDVDAAIPSVDRHFPDGAVAAVRSVLTRPRTEIAGWWAIAPGDDLDHAGDRVATAGMSRFKIKLPGSDPVADAERVAEIHRVVTGWVDDPVLSVDTNEGSRDPAAVLTFLEALAALAPEALAAVSYLEQPTPRDTLADHHWDEIGERVPVLVDEGLAGMDELLLAHRTGWSGVAVKTCKGHSFALVAAAWARQRGMVISVQDLTNIGRSAIQSYLLAAHLPSINGIELNSPQYLPRANDAWLPRLSGLFDLHDGMHRLDPAGVIGLGSDL